MAGNAGLAQRVQANVHAQQPLSSGLPQQRWSFDKRPFLNEIAIEYGPREVLAEYFLLAERASRQRGVDLVFAPIRALKEVNQANRDTWLPLFPLFDADYGADDENTICLLGLDPSGEPVVTQAARFYNMAASNFHDEAESLRFFYRDTEARRAVGETCTVSAPGARGIRGQVVFSGGGWYRPDYRKRGFFEILPRISRALALTRWSSDYTMTMMAEKVVAGGRNHAAGYETLEWDVMMRGSPLGDIRLAVLWMNTDFLVDDLSVAVRDLRPQVDTLIQNRA